MKKSTKALLMTLCAVALVVGTLFGTLAYLTDSEAVTNTFTVGQVHIKLDEADVKSDGTLETNNRVQSNEYHLLPGQSYIKDPTVTVEATSDESYIRMLVTVENYTDLKEAFPVSKYAEWYAGDVFLLQYLVNGWDNAKWISTGNVSVDTTKDTATYEFRYYTTATPASGPSDNGVLEPLFTEIKVPGTVNNEELAKLANVVIKVEAHAIQAVGFDNADAAWTAFTK